MGELTFPCLSPVLVPVELLEANHYNPNRVSRDKMDALFLSMQRSGVTRPIIVFHDRDRDRYVIVDGFHRWAILKGRFQASHVPVVILNAALDRRMKATILFNQAKGRHRVDRTNALIHRLRELGWPCDKIAKELNIDAERVLRALQDQGIAEYYRYRKFSRAWIWIEGGEEPDEQSEMAVR